jgi:formate hydrogenlyase subunit 3/multisubunit Na+/H+ antiporter MnhD subunit
VITSRSIEENTVKSLPFSIVFAGLGVALLVLGIAGMIYGEDAGDQLIGALVAIIGVIQIIFGGLRRRTEDDQPHGAHAHTS